MIKCEEEEEEEVEVKRKTNSKICLREDPITET
jgi:hypothetical protein